VAQLARFGGRDESRALHRRGNRPWIAVEDDILQLPDTGHFALGPAGGPWRNVALDTCDAGVRRVFVGSKLRLHHVAALTAELDCLHMLDSPIGSLGPDNQIRQRGKSNKKTQSSQSGLPVGFLRESFPYTAPAEVGSDRNQRQAETKDDRDGNK